MKLCLCGCGQEVKPKNTFIHGHNGRVRSEELTERIASFHKSAKGKVI